MVTGRLALCGGTLTAEFVEFEAKRSFEWLQGDRQESRRNASVLVLRELMQNAPTLLYSYMGQFLDLIWLALRDPKLNIRESAAESLESALQIMYSRENVQQSLWYSRILEEIQKGYKLGTPEAIHGSLLATGALLAKSGRMMEAHFDDTCEALLKYKVREIYDVIINHIINQLG